MRNLKVILVSIVLSSCASTSGVLKMGKDTYTVSADASPAAGGVNGAKKMAYAEANKECEKQDRIMVVQHESVERTTRAGAGNVDLTFVCLDKNDPESNTRPVYKQPPSVVIENK